MCVHVCPHVSMNECVSLGCECENVNSFVVNYREGSCGRMCWDLGKSSRHRPGASPEGACPAWHPAPESPGTASPQRLARPLGSFPPRSPLPGLASSCLPWAAQASRCPSISLGCRIVVMFSYQRPLTPKRNQARVRYKNQLTPGTIFPWKITKELNNSAF